MRINKNIQGFTLIELLVVIAIIGVLAAIILASLGTARNKGNDAAIKSDLKNAYTQAELFRSYNNEHFVGATSALGTATDVCSSLGLVNGNVKGVYSSLQAIQGLLGSGYTINVYTGSSMPQGSATKVTCHATPLSGSYAPYDAFAIETPLLGTYSGMTKPMFCIDSQGNNVIYDAAVSSKLAGGDADCS